MSKYQEIQNSIKLLENLEKLEKSKSFTIWSTDGDGDEYEAKGVLANAFQFALTEEKQRILTKLKELGCSPK